ncbi:hypothetical protein GIB67_039677 [Kingdonia uniflora]|uniref:Uncharacterized protein n=1 Tax=Kingdonia uniflora TaxID=39325 RepID=A0A7J7MPV0_9MAGN|nr:hypothetical protein GIB67_039677 [Kingdonia uniflora]
MVEVSEVILFMGHFVAAGHNEIFLGMGWWPRMGCLKLMWYARIGCQEPGIEGRGLSKAGPCIVIDSEGGSMGRENEENILLRGNVAHIPFAIVEPDVGTSKRSQRRTHIVRESDEEEEEVEERGEEVGVELLGDERDKEEEEKSKTRVGKDGDCSGTVEGRVFVYGFTPGGNYGFQGEDSFRNTTTSLKADKAEPTNNGLKHPETYIDDLINESEDWVNKVFWKLGIVRKRYKKIDTLLRDEPVATGPSRRRREAVTSAKVGEMDYSNLTGKSSFIPRARRGMPISTHSTVPETVPERKQGGELRRFGARAQMAMSERLKETGDEGELKKWTILFLETSIKELEGEQLHIHSNVARETQVVVTSYDVKVAVLEAKVASQKEQLNDNHTHFQAMFDQECEEEPIVENMLSMEGFETNLVVEGAGVDPVVKDTGGKNVKENSSIEGVANLVENTGVLWLYSSVVRGKLDVTANSHSDTKAKAAVGGKLGNCVEFAGRQFRGCTIAVGEEYFYLLADFEVEKRDRGIDKSISLEYFDGDIRGDLSEGFLCYLSQLEYGLSLPLTNLVKRIMNTIEACPVQLNGNMWEERVEALYCGQYRGRYRECKYLKSDKEDDKIKSGYKYSWKYEHKGEAKGEWSSSKEFHYNYYKANGHLHYYCWKLHPELRPKEEKRNKEIYALAAEEETELELLLKGLGLSRKKKVDNRSNKVLMAQSTRSMAGIDVGKRQKRMLKALTASGTTGSGDDVIDKRRRVKPSGESREKVAEGRSASVDDLKEVEERSRMAVLQGEEDTSKMAARLVKGIWLSIEEEKSELKKVNVELEKKLARSRADGLKDVKQLKASHAKAINTIKLGTYVEEEDEEEAEAVGIVDGQDGVSCQTVLDIQGDDVELPEGGSVKAVRKMSLRINDLESGFARERETSKALLSVQAELQVELESSRSREDGVLMCNREFAEQFDRMKEGNENREDQCVKAHFRLVELTQAIFDLTLQVDEKDSEIKKGLNELAEHKLDAAHIREKVLEGEIKANESLVKRKEELLKEMLAREELNVEIGRLRAWVVDFEAMNLAESTKYIVKLKEDVIYHAKADAEMTELKNDYARLESRLERFIARFTTMVIPDASRSDLLKAIVAYFVEEAKRLSLNEIPCSKLCWIRDAFVDLR